MRAELLTPDDGAWNEALLACRHDIYHLPDYARLERRRQDSTARAFLCRSGDKSFLVPLLLRKIAMGGGVNDGMPLSDATSAYGYPGVILSEAARADSDFVRQAVNALVGLMRDRAICSAFLRLHPVINEADVPMFDPDWLQHIGPTVSIDLTLSEDLIWSRTRRGHQSTINRCKRLGFAGRMVPLAGHIDLFTPIYADTLARVNAADDYFFDRAYFEALAALGERIQLCLVEKDGVPAAACVMFEQDGLMQAHLGGTAADFINGSPFNFLIDFARYWGKARGNRCLHMGGGVGGGNDGVFSFKAGFSRVRHLFFALNLVADRDWYGRLIASRAAWLGVCEERLIETAFFPGYRATLAQQPV